MLSLTSTSASVAASTAPSPHLVKAAHEFEAQMMKELLKPLTSGSSLTGDEDERGSNSALGDFAAGALGQALSERGGLGIAKSICADLSRSENSTESAQVTKKLPVDTGMRGKE